MSAHEQAPEFDRSVPLLASIAFGGVIGAGARYAASRLWPTDGFGWTTLAVNTTGCLLMGALMAWLATRERPHPLLRPFLGVGVLGGYTTFSTFTEETRELLADGRPASALAYLVTSVGSGLAAILVGRLLIRGLPRPTLRAPDISNATRRRSGSKCQVRGRSGR